METKCVSLDDIVAYFTVLIVSFQFTRTGVQYTEVFCRRIVTNIHVLNCSLLSTPIAQYNNRNLCLRYQAFVAKHEDMSIGGGGVGNN